MKLLNAIIFSADCEIKNVKTDGIVNIFTDFYFYMYANRLHVIASKIIVICL